MVGVISLLMFLLLSSANGQSQTPMLDILDAMEVMMGRYSQYDREYYQNLRDCMEFMDPKLPTSQDAAWQGFIDYWDMNGTPDDPWGENGSSYWEHNITVTQVHNMTIYEPCGYTSNVAYYRPVTEMCERMISGNGFDLPDSFIQSFARGFANMAFGSSFMHGSNTELGHRQDVDNLAVLAYQMHQASLDAIPYSPILHDLSYAPRSKTAFELINEFQDMFLSSPVEEWYDETVAMDIPDYMLTYTGIFTTMLSIGFDPVVVDTLLPTLAGAFGVSDELLSFVMDSYVPELRNATASLNLGPIARPLFLGNGIGTVVKLLYGFVWQEEVLPFPVLLTEEANQRGADLIPLVNKRASTLQTFRHFDQDFQDGIDVYPGDFDCNPTIPHPKWHLESAVGLLDLAYMSNEMYAILLNMDK